jgi:hypothetical protein
MIGLKGTLNVRPHRSSQFAPQSKKDKTGNRQLGRTARRMRQRAQK